MRTLEGSRAIRTIVALGEHPKGLTNIQVTNAVAPCKNVFGNDCGNFSRTLKELIDFGIVRKEGPIFKLNEWFKDTIDYAYFSGAETYKEKSLPFMKRLNLKMFYFKLAKSMSYYKVIKRLCYESAVDTTILFGKYNRPLIVSMRDCGVIDTERTGRIVLNRLSQEFKSTLEYKFIKERILGVGQW